MTMFVRPDVSLSGWQGIKIQFLPPSLSLFLSLFLSLPLPLSSLAFSLARCVCTRAWNDGSIYDQ